jgi:hypothetical protein
MAERKDSREFNSSRNYSEDMAHFKAASSFALGIFSLSAMPRAVTRFALAADRLLKITMPKDHHHFRLSDSTNHKTSDAAHKTNLRHI